MFTEIDQLELDIRNAEASAERQRDILQFDWGDRLVESAVVLLDYFELRLARLRKELSAQIHIN